MALEGRAGVMQRRGYEDDAAACGGICPGIGIRLSGFEKVGDSGSQGVIGAYHVNVDDGFEGVRGDAYYWGEEVPCCAGTEFSLSLCI